MYNLQDNIVALATLSGKSALNVIRISGSGSMRVYNQLTKKQTKPTPNYAMPCKLYNYKTGRIIDFAIVTYFKSPKSYTGEDLLEISVHGGNIIANQIIGLLINDGVRLAKPGEFSYRAYMNNKIDLIQAEAISSIVSANNNIDSFYHINTINGNLSEALSESKKELIKIITIKEHELDFMDDEITKESHESLIIDLENIIDSGISTIEKCKTVENIKSELRIVIIGAPNVGKSSIFNKIIGNQRAIVSNIKGTTRDVIETSIYIGENTATLIDTAGLHKTQNKIERLGIEKTIEQISNSQIVVVVDTKNPEEFFKKQKKIIGNKHVILVQNKTDGLKTTGRHRWIQTSCKTGLGINILSTELSTICNDKIKDIYKQNDYIINVRQGGLLNAISKQLAEAVSVFKETKDTTICLSYLYGALDLYAELIRPQEEGLVLDKIFGDFCVGK